MTIEFDNWAENVVSGVGAGTDTISFTNAGNILLAACMLDDTVITVSTVGYNANSLTQLFQTKLSSQTLWVGYLLNPTIGTHDLVFNFDGGSTGIYRTGCISFKNVSEVDPIGGDASTTDTGSGASSLSVTPTVQGLSGMLVDFFSTARMDTANAISPQTEKMNNTGSWSGGNNHVGGISYQPHTGSNLAMGWENFTNQGGTTQKLLYAVELLPIRSIPQINMF